MTRVSMLFIGDAFYFITYSACPVHTHKPLYL